MLLLIVPEKSKPYIMIHDLKKKDINSMTDTKIKIICIMHFMCLIKYPIFHCKENSTKKNL